MFFILFYRPSKTDVCDTCTELGIAIKETTAPEKKVELERKLAEHVMQYKAQIGNLHNHEEKCPAEKLENPEFPWITIATDLQQTQPVPRLVNQSAYYKQKVRFLFCSNDICCIILTSK